MTRTLAMVAGLVAFGACTRSDAPAAKAPERPDTQGIEGHGGVAMETPKPRALGLPHQTAPRAEDGVVDPSRFMMEPDAADGRLDPEWEARLSARDAYMVGYQLKDSDPQEAARFFRRVMELTPPGDEYHQKAQAQLRGR